ncbi:hypothetical protein CANARDRAFT_190240, partial [[Candida] arabinofermentans NRRL YB-2248]
PTVLTIAGSDPSGGAGIEADIKTITAFRCNAITCIDCLTVQSTLGVKFKHSTTANTIQYILNALQDRKIDGVKCGMITSQVLDHLPQFIKSNNVRNLVIDPIISSTSGFTLSKIDLIKRSIRELYHYATLVSPNFNEALDILSAMDVNHTYGDQEMTLETLKSLTKLSTMTLGCRAVLLKGGHMPCSFTDNGMMLDILYDAVTETFTIFSHPRLNGLKNTHGTGCTLSSSIAAGLANGEELEKAVGDAICYVHQGLVFADPTIGEGNGPLNHGFKL